MKILLPFLFLALTSLAQDDAGEDFPPPERNQPWVHAKSGLRFPDKLAGMICEGGYDYKDVPSGYSLRYVERDLQIRADVYVFPCPHPLDTPADIKEAARIEAGNVLGGIEEMGKRGLYSGIRQNEATYKEVDLYPEGSGKTGWLEFSVNAVIHEDLPVGKSSDKIFSYTGIALHRGHYVKVRCTVPAEENKEREKELSDFVSAVRFLIFIEPGLSAEAGKKIKVYRADPLSEDARKAAAGVLVYAEKTATFSFTVPDKMVTLGASLKPTVDKAEEDVMRAFLVGVADAALRQPPPKTVDFEQGGAEEILRLYEALKKKHPKLRSADMDALAKATKVGKGGEWLLEGKFP